MPHQSFQVVGTPIELQSSNNSAAPKTVTSPVNSATSKTEKQTATSQKTYAEAPEEPPGICGAPTASGRLCQRKVRGGGYCWQHKDKF